VPVVWPGLILLCCHLPHSCLPLGNGRRVNGLREATARRAAIDVADYEGRPERRPLSRADVSHLIEDGVDPLFVQQQAGHSWASTTAAYTTVGADARNRMLRSALARAFGEGDGE
jgi:hypothetical protein